MRETEGVEVIEQKTAEQETAEQKAAQVRTAGGDGENSEGGRNRSKRGISGSTLKLIAVIAMLLDHTAASLLEPAILSNPENFELGGIKMTPIVIVYWIMRGIGRIAFPIYIFLLLEGFAHTSNRLRYLGRLALFALISEIPFDMALWVSRTQILEMHILEFDYQNVFFTLAIGLLTIMLIDKMWECRREIYTKIVIACMIAGLGMGLAVLLRTDYDAAGVAAIVFAYVLRRWRVPQMAGLCLPLIYSSGIEAVALIDILPVAFYNGRRGWNLKWVFYVFYPMHLLVLGLIRMCMYA